MVHPLAGDMENSTQIRQRRGWQKGDCITGNLGKHAEIGRRDLCSIDMYSAGLPRRQKETVV